MQKTAYEMRISDWSSDVCSSDLAAATRANAACTICLTHCRAMAAVSSGAAGLATANAAAGGSIPRPPLVDTGVAPYIGSMHPRRLAPCLLLFLAGLAAAPAAEPAAAAERSEEHTSELQSLMHIS